MFPNGKTGDKAKLLGCLKTYSRALEHELYSILLMSEPYPAKETSPEVIC